MLWVHKKWAKVDPRKANQPAMTKPQAMEVVREEFLAKEVMGAKDEVVRLCVRICWRRRWSLSTPGVASGSLDALQRAPSATPPGTSNCAFRSAALSSGCKTRPYSCLVRTWRASRT